MGETGTSAGILVAAPVMEPDFDRPISNDELVAAFNANTRLVEDDEFVDDVPPRGKDAIGL